MSFVDKDEKGLLATADTKILPPDEVDPVFLDTGLGDNQ